MKSTAFLVFLGITLAENALGDTPVIPRVREVHSPGALYRAVVEPKNFDTDERGVLSVWRIDGEVQSRVYRRHTVNEVQPSRVLVGDDGTVVTLDDWYRSGYEHAVVVYAPSGWVVLDRTLENLLSDADLKKTRHTVSSRHWLYGGEPARILSDRVELTALWGATIVVDLKSGKVSVKQDCFPNLVHFLESELQSLTRIEYERSMPDSSVTCTWRTAESGCEFVNLRTKLRRSQKCKASHAPSREALAPLLQLLGAVESPSYCSGCRDKFELRLFFEQPSGVHSYSFAISDYAHAEPSTRRLLNEVTRSLGFDISGISS